MTAEVVGYRSRKRKDEAKRAAKAKKEKILLAVCGVVLLGLVAVEGPKTLKKLHGSSGAAPAAVAPSPSAAQATGSPTAGATAKAADLQATKHLASKDPFVAQLGAQAAAAQEASPVTGPAVRASHFVKKDPFVQQVTFAAPTTSSAAPAPDTPTGTAGSTTGKPANAKAASKSGNYIVMVASIPISDGRAVARAAAATARSHGVARVKIVDSSDYPTLRTGFYAVYSGPYPTLGELLPALEQVRGKGYASAYTRRLAH
jgi:hypothetical protein